MITQQIISSELEVLKKHIDSGDIRIPSLWQGLKPGFIIMGWMIFCPLLISFLITQKTSETLTAVLAGGWLGLIILFIVARIRMLYFSLPEEFLKTSSVMRIISSKLKVYFIVYMGIIFLWSFLGGGIIYGFGAILVTVIMAFLIQLDIGRYQFVGVIDAINSYVKNKKLSRVK
ncbi:conjugal transfer entry exclusion protein TraS [Escherichia coli]|uniref:conjugal transfer entry exclusion protein TraS n=1 Tax=Enterobacteriaceae TaxID=543 RepID=UPI000D0269D2|nr:MULTISPECIES: conjugal transfer entry exclusion protein TraS [Enterobacteriaceae]MBG0951355.1 conjugal transfer protein TraS [Escherichia coli]MBN3340098.1 Protein TraS [Klebsiella pneumoniae]MCC4205768.1 conjugal transfer entry exclusion protein TraS [Escherichia coli]MDA4325271.1 conjugal transfer entry exclusion protein TraS [Escherichia coli]MDZ8914583.1 conjugal transfer entry exclusion protein TraS [Escherichia coli]